MSAALGPICPGCGQPPARGRLMCDACWSDVPAAARRDLIVAWKAYQARPGSLKARHEYEAAIGAAVGNIP